MQTKHKRMNHDAINKTTQINTNIKQSTKTTQINTEIKHQSSNNKINFSKVEICWRDLGRTKQTEKNQ